MSVMAAVDMADEVVYLRGCFDALLSLCSDADKECRLIYPRDKHGFLTTQQVREILDGRHKPETPSAPATNLTNQALLALVTEHHRDCSPPCMCIRLQRLQEARAALEKVVE